MLELLTDELLQLCFPHPLLLLVNNRHRISRNKYGTTTVVTIDGRLLYQNRGVSDSFLTIPLPQGQLCKYCISEFPGLAVIVTTCGKGYFYRFNGKRIDPSKIVFAYSTYRPNIKIRLVTEEGTSFSVESKGLAYYTVERSDSCYTRSRYIFRERSIRPYRREKATTVLRHYNQEYQSPQRLITERLSNGMIAYNHTYQMKQDGTLELQ